MPGLGLLAVTSPDLLHRGWTAAQARALAGRARAQPRRATALEASPRAADSSPRRRRAGVAVLARRRARPARRAARRREVRPDRKPRRSLRRLPPRRRGDHRGRRGNYCSRTDDKVPVYATAVYGAHPGPGTASEQQTQIFLGRGRAPRAAAIARPPILPPSRTKRKSIRRDPPPHARGPGPDRGPTCASASRKSSNMRGECSTSWVTRSPPTARSSSATAPSLQSVDIVGQMLGHIANVIRSSDPEGAVELIGMAELKARLQRRSIG